jgi:hypothetical protein
MVRLHRFKSMGETYYEIDGKKIFAKDLIAIQLGQEPKHCISHLMCDKYNRETSDYLKSIQKPEK